MDQIGLEIVERERATGLVVDLLGTVRVIIKDSCMRPKHKRFGIDACREGFVGNLI